MKFETDTPDFDWREISVFHISASFLYGFDGCLWDSGQRKSFKQPRVWYRVKCFAVVKPHAKQISPVLTYFIKDQLVDE